MSHAAYASPLVLEPGVSRYLIIYIILLHVLTLTVVAMPLNLPVWVRVSLALALVISLVWQWRRVSFNHSARINRLVWEVDDDWMLWMNDGTEFAAQLRPDTYESIWLVILHFQLQHGRRRSLVILPDMLDQQSFRRLRVRLRQTRLAANTEET